MKSFSIIPKPGIFTISAIVLIAGVLTLGFYTICDSHVCDSTCGKSGEVTALNAYINIPIINNNFPKTATITKVRVEVPGDFCYGAEYEPEGAGHGYVCRCVVGSETRLKEIRFIRFEDDYTVALSASSSYCVCRNPIHYDTNTFVLDTNYSFSDAKVLCRLTLDVDTAPSGLYTVIYSYTLPGSGTVRENTLTFTIP
jgi:hypothetical protein